ncbi:MAG: hypothetical protein JXB23_09565, partial [Candidatus Aminicenantes bacterium]|nr:hypothetical protein [Candidatus Aminicenantes bacterium]
KWTNYGISDKTKKNLSELFENMFEENFADSEEFEEDRKNLEICMKENIRMQKCGETIPSS